MYLKVLSTITFVLIWNLNYTQVTIKSKSIVTNLATYLNNVRLSVYSQGYSDSV